MGTNALPNTIYMGTKVVLTEGKKKMGLSA